VKDRVLEASLNFRSGPPDQFVFVDSITEAYTKRHSFGNNTPTPPISPFKGKNAEQCWYLLKRLCAETGSQIDQDNFAILDERSLLDDTALVVQAEEGEGADSVRVEFKLVLTRVLQYFVGDLCVGEDIEAAEETDDDVVRGGRPLAA
jgi:hypothetical protein